MRSALFTVATSLLPICACNTQPAGGPANRNDNGNGGNDNQSPPAQRFTLVATAVGGGEVEPSAGTFAAGEEVTLTATADPGWRFDHWEGELTSADEVLQLTVVEDTELTAFFVKLPVPPPDNTNDNISNPNDNSGTEPGGDFDTATPLTLDASGRAVVQSALVQSDDIHVFDLGPLALGDQFSATCEAADGSPLDPLMALFDADGFRVFWNDDVDLDSGDFDAAISGLIRHDSARYFLALTSTDFAETTGDYVLTVEVQRGVGAASISGHTIVLDFDGAADVTVAGMDWGDPAPFDAADIDPAFAGQTETLKQTILSIVRADFAAFDMTVLSTDDAAPAVPVTRVFMGEDDDQLLGIADMLDFYNASKTDNVIVFAHAFGFLPGDLATIGQAIGNVVSHEVGHSLGLMHTRDVTELMDNGGSDMPLLSDQSFGTAPVFDFPIGLQNAPLLLTESLGPSAAAKRIPPEAGGLRCGTCGLPIDKLIRQFK